MGKLLGAVNGATDVASCVLFPWTVTCASVERVGALRVRIPWRASIPSSPARSISIIILAFLPSAAFRVSGVVPNLGVSRTKPTPDTPAQISFIVALLANDALDHGGGVEVIAEPVAIKSSITSTPPASLAIGLLGVETVGAAAKTEAESESAASTASRSPFPGDQLLETVSAPQAPRASFMSLGPKLASFCILLLVLLTLHLLGDEACAEAVKLQVTSRSSL